MTGMEKSLVAVHTNAFCSVRVFGMKVFFSVLRSYNETIPEYEVNTRSMTQKSEIRHTHWTRKCSYLVIMVEKDNPECTRDHYSCCTDELFALVLYQHSGILYRTEK